ncbi:PilW family protein [Natranaerobius trueperi]|uniref:Prepilin-type cleavage/methylation domain-containing protein n=1 Tax=Natranaerobius trueperi TaxID=759412 RepID=A0A226C0B9_9FIRM|nr:prepilin-type N-terminal cleavage/methylation domain-containing protein [Natranaerobius trueperi]OWZ84635.1 hypothetical protein CDO51_02420 [Natranaerobius trueperi]
MGKLYQLKSQKGITLVEVLIVVALFMIVLGLGYTVIHYSRTTFDTGTTRADTQQAARLVKNYITDELRNAMEITTDHSGNGYGVLELDAGSLIINEDTVKIDKQIEKIELEVIEENNTGSAILKMIINVEGDYEYENEILLNNLSIDQLDIDDSVDLADEKLYYSNP